MKATQKQVKAIQKAFENLEKDFEIFPFELEVGDEKVSLDFPRDNNLDFPLDVILRYIDELDNLDISTERVSSNRISQYPIEIEGAIPEIVFSEFKFVVKVPGKFIIRVMDNPILIGIGAVKLDRFDKYWPPCSRFHAVEIEYLSLESKLEKDLEKKILQSYLYELSNLSNAAVDFGTISDLIYEDYESLPEDTLETDVLPNYTEGMDLFRKAMGSFDNEIRFLYFYKIIEFYSPIAAKRVAYENLTRKLDGIRFKGADNSQIKSIIAIVDKFRADQSDKELAQNLISVTIDIVDVFPNLPEYFQKKLTKLHNFKRDDFNYESKPEIQQAVRNSLGGILYSTRNNIVHAKSNYTPDGNECPTENLYDLNAFMKGLTYSIISWYNRLPDHLRNSD